MIIHLFKLISKQWSKNIWIVVELFLIFSLMWYIMDYFSVMYLTSRTPVGFDITDTYKVNLSMVQPSSPKHIAYKKGSEEPGQNFLRIVERLRQHPEVEAVSIGRWYYPYCPSYSGSVYHKNGLQCQAQILSTTPDYFRIFRVAPAEGGSPELLANALQQKGVVISQTLENILFPDSPATGQDIYTHEDDSIGIRVNAVTNELKRYAYVRPQPSLYTLFNEQSLLEKNERNIWGTTDICFRVKPGHGSAHFAETFTREMKPQLIAGNYFLINITPISKYKDSMLKSGGVYEDIRNRIIFTFFFILNIFLGMIGTFWLCIEKRKEETGLRMAIGSTRKGIMVQMMGESFVLACIALLPAIFVWINLVMMDVMPVKELDMTWQRFTLNTLLTVVPIGIVIIIAIWYPARRSMLIQPAEALHYE